jgi:hypothetical protein
MTIGQARQRGHLVLRAYYQILGREILPLAKIERPDLEIGARLVSVT